jgi:N6-adenosine-specific RNA methylase IME4
MTLPTTNERRYRTIVADPPWEYVKTSEQARCSSCGRVRYAAPATRCSCLHPVFQRHEHALPYDTLSVKQIRALPVASLAEADAHLYLWTTQRYLRDAFDIAYCWGFTQKLVLTWAKPPKGMSTGPFVNSSEFVLFATQGAVGGMGRHMGTVFSWPRSEHSVKPEAFLDIVEQVSPGPYLEMFARRARFGWDYYGDESLGTAEVPA